MWHDCVANTHTKQGWKDNLSDKVENHGLSIYLMKELLQKTGWINTKRKNKVDQSIWKDVWLQEESGNANKNEIIFFNLLDG